MPSTAVLATSNLESVHRRPPCFHQDSHPRPRGCKHGLALLVVSAGRMHAAVTVMTRCLNSQWPSCFTSSSCSRPCSTTSGLSVTVLEFTPVQMQSAVAVLPFTTIFTVRQHHAEGAVCASSRVLPSPCRWRRCRLRPGRLAVDVERAVPGVPVREVIVAAAEAGVIVHEDVFDQRAIHQGGRGDGRCVRGTGRSGGDGDDTRGEKAGGEQPRMIGLSMAGSLVVVGSTIRQSGGQPVWLDGPGFTAALSPASSDTGRPARCCPFRTATSGST